MTVGFKCPHCGSGRLWRKGLVPTVKGKKIRYVCFDCGKTFYAPTKTVAKPLAKAPAKPAIKLKTGHKARKK